MYSALLLGTFLFKDQNMLIHFHYLGKYIPDSEPSVLLSFLSFAHSFETWL
jgi:hypothetical protein